MTTAPNGLTARKPYSTQGGGKGPEETNVVAHHHDHEHDHEHGDHSHSHSIFSKHVHSHGEEGHDATAEEVIKALQGSGDRGSRITLVGLFANIGLTASKGAAGWYMNSAALLAESAHSLSDLLGDFVTLFCWKLSRKPPSARYPYGFAKFETLGTTTVSLLLVGGALGIGFHSYYLLVDALTHTASSLPPGVLQSAIQNVTEVAQSVPIPAIEPGHGHGHALDPNAAWFAALGVIAKEWLYRVTEKVAREEKSPVLHANALHHRSDAYSSVVALVAILGSSWFPALPLDPVGGFLISIVILRQGLGILVGAFKELMDSGVSAKTHASLVRSVQPLIAPPTAQNGNGTTTSDVPSLLAIHDLRARRAGSMTFVDLTADVPRDLSVSEAASMEEKIERTMKEARREIAEVRVRFRAV
ncbi:hypothetical protein PUNSTDRAFT_50649 [Punctularia strigosozonata HHB-11173 SS5]|uniref:uncharacterized protein n=1 Tax=Punctularia strigosozonata (strain HHB-11173) TaxID=741275 RepID=UPI0004416E5B|nr:uncharacterized protein PUNSTDRAFT_50649 [Punctularia strigosozonata HHB-11173 SS5]EIN11789.1 hypothetical protein PUNSTDRAFT_50649 [Punctularia strigosozonata HHB-11173 SS5]